MPLDARYAAQVRLLVQTLPLVAVEKATATTMLVRSAWRWLSGRKTINAR